MFVSLLLQDILRMNSYVSDTLVLQIVSTMATTSLEDVAKASQGSPLLIFQLYVQRDRDFTASLIHSKLLCPFWQPDSCFAC